MFDKWAMAYVHSTQDDFMELSDIMDSASKKHEQTVKEVVSLLRSYLGKEIDFTPKHA
jgi:tetrahydromethanopterin S-methyltransferase subunit G